MNTSIGVSLPPIFCHNIHCDKKLSAWEIKNYHPTRVSKYWLCFACRRLSHKRALFVPCQKCFEPFEQYNMRKYCDKCCKHVRGRAF